MVRAGRNICHKRMRKGSRALNVWGNHPSLMAKTYFKMTPSAKFGRAMIRNVVIVEARSIAVFARALGYSVRLQHHSFRYMTRSRRIAKLGFSALGASTEHVVTCDKMAIALRRTYGAKLRCSVVSVAYAIKPAETVREVAATPRTIGTLGNLGTAKSLDIVIDTFDVISKRGEFRLVLGGPIVDAKAKGWLAEASERHGDRIAWVGSLSGQAKDEFLARLDVFLFPSRHLDESFGLVVMEALQMGIPVIMVPNLCMGGTELGAAGLAITEIDDFSALAADQVTMWQREPARYQQAQTAARSLAIAHIAIANGAAASLWTGTTPSNLEAGVA